MVSNLENNQDSHKTALMDNILDSHRVDLIVVHNLNKVIVDLTTDPIVERNHNRVMDPMMEAMIKSLT